MAVQKITDMTAITGSNTASDELFLVIDASTNTAKKIKRATAVTISGTIKGWLIKIKIVFFPLNGTVLVVPNAAAVARTVEMIDANVAITNERIAASWTNSFSAALRYHLSENPSQNIRLLPALKE